MRKIIYLDNAATTKVAPEVLEIMRKTEDDLFYNSSAAYSSGVRVKKEIENAARIIKQKLGGENGDLYFMSGATEANNTVVFGKIRNKKDRTVIAAGGHSSTDKPAVYLQQQGFNVAFAPLLPTGEIDIDKISDLINEDTKLFVFELVNSNVGTKQDAEKLIRAVRTKNKNVHIHCDAVQGFCKFDFNAAKLGADSITVSSHKIHGPKGVGALWVKKGAVIKPLIIGGDHGLRAGTQNNAGIIGFGKAVEIFNTKENYGKVSGLHRFLIKNLQPEIKINGLNNNPYITNLLLPNVFGETVLNALSAKDIFVGTGSACAVNAAGDRTLAAMGLPSKQQKQVIRVSLCKDNTEEEIDVFIKELKGTVNELK
jgi:cysteine desulfurase